KNSNCLKRSFKQFRIRSLSLERLHNNKVVCVICGQRRIINSHPKGIESNKKKSKKYNRHVSAPIPEE
ncbi:MAG: hypothetical protein AAB524_02415, partial [Patescibacteria group bacterium]